jgi:S-DNA-T family DNA segregation ATPase FtsK/SpoIIIE
MSIVLLILRQAALLLLLSMVVSGVVILQRHLRHPLTPYRRQLRELLRHAGLLGDGEWLPVVGYRETSVGLSVDLRIPKGRSTVDFERIATALADHLALREVRVSRPEPGVVRLVLVITDPLTTGRTPPWPLAELPPDAGAWSLGRPVPIATADTGETVELDLWASSLLVSGQPGSGKSNVLWLLALSAALDPSAFVAVIDAKGGVEFAELQRRADAFATDQASAIVLMRRLLLEVQRRQLVLRDQAGVRKLSPGMEHMKGLCLVIDELTEVLNTGDRDADKEAQILLRRLLATGRSAGLTVVCALQKADSTNLATNIRDLIRYRVAMRCGNRASAVVVLGEDAVSAGAAPHAIPPGREYAGIGYLVTEEGEVRRCRTPYLEDVEIARLCKRAAALHSCADDGTFELPLDPTSPLAPTSPRRRHQNRSGSPDHAA